MQDYHLKIEELKKSRIKAALCIVAETKGSTPRKAGSKMIVLSDKTSIGTIGGGNVENEVINMIPEILQKNEPVLKHFNLNDDLNMHCGGSMSVYIEPIVQLPHLYIFGGGHVGRAVAKLALTLDFEITIFDQREGIFGDIDFVGCQLVVDNFKSAIEKAHFSDDTFIVIVTPSHTHDEEVLQLVAHKPHAYIGLMGSKAKVALAKERFIRENIMTAEELDKIDMPIGIKFAAETPAELAVSIMAKVIDVRNTLKKA